MKNMFSECKKLTNLNLNNFVTNNVEDMFGMFYNCEELTNLSVTSFNTEQVFDVSYMFANCYKLENLDLSSFDFTIAMTYPDSRYIITHENVVIKVKNEEAKNFIMSHNIFLAEDNFIISS